MPLNLIKKYNTLLDLIAYNEYQRERSLKAIFDRDIVNNDNFKFNGKYIQPTPSNGEIKMSILFTHLTTVTVDPKTRKRDFDIHRSVRLHWIRHHIECKEKNNVLHFSVDEPNGKRTYIYDKNENYVIILEPLRNKNEYYLLTAYYLRGKDAKRNSILKKYKRKLNELL